MGKLLSGCGALVVLLALAGCNNSAGPSAADTNPAGARSTKATEKQEGTAPAGTMKEPGHIPGG